MMLWCYDDDEDAVADYDDDEVDDDDDVEASHDRGHGSHPGSINWRHPTKSPHNTPSTLCIVSHSAKQCAIWRTLKPSVHQWCVHGVQWLRQGALHPTRSPKTHLWPTYGADEDDDDENDEDVDNENDVDDDLNCTMVIRCDGSDFNFTLD